MARRDALKKERRREQRRKSATAAGKPPTRPDARASPEMPEAEIPAEVRAALIELHNRDSNGETIRYGRARGLGKPTFDKQETFDVERIVNRLGEAFRFLSWGAGGALSAEIEAVTDYIAEIERAYT